VESIVASIKKHGKKWRAQVEKNGRRASKVLNTKSEANEWAATKELEFASPIKYVSKRKRVADLFDRYASEVSTTKKGERWEVIRLNKLKRSWLANLLVGEISAKDISKWRDEQLKLISPASVNREMNLLSAVFQTAVKDWEWVESNPVRGITRPQSPKPRDRRISQSEIDLILDALGYQGKIETKKHQVAVMFLIAIETAMRLGEIHSLSESDINLPGRYVTLSDTKNNDARHVPLSMEAVRLFDLALPDLFTVSKASVSVLFRKSVAMAGIDNMTFHDSRHEAITRLARKLDVLDLARMIGHRDPKSLMIYYNATATEIAGRLG